jgi:uncharacterized protein
MLPILAAIACTIQPAPEPSAGVPFTSVRLTDPFWAPRQAVNAAATLEHNFDQCERTGRIANLERAGRGERGKYAGYFFNDSDVFKAVEGASDVLATRSDEALRQRLIRLAEVITRAQQPDGYLNSYFTLEAPDQRWADLKDKHELYCAGHLIEAGIAHHRATGQKDLLDAAVRLANHIQARFGPGKTPGVCGHPEIELALIRLADHTGNASYRDLARHFVHERGVGTGRPLMGEYCQDHKPLARQEQVVGHAVRAMYLYSAAADLARLDGDRPMRDALVRLWDDLTLRKMYVTGGIGNSAKNEGFTGPYDLPNESAYAETCASIGLVLWAHRMNLLEGDARYADVMERVLYNAAASGVSLDGRSFFYVNPMSSTGGAVRQPWFACACCPPNILRLIASLGGYVYVRDADGLRVNLYAAGVAEPWPRGTITQETRYPWDGRVELRVEAPTDRGEWSLRLRIPSWSRGHTLSINGTPLDARVEKGYAVIRRRWSRGDRVVLNLDMPVERVVGHPSLSSARDRVAVQRGPIVYCAEAADNPAGVRDLLLPPEGPFTQTWRPDLLGGVVVLSAPARRAEPFPADRLYSAVRPGDPATITLIPYCTWANRGPSEMTVWVPRHDGAVVERPNAWVRPSASHHFSTDSIEAPCDGIVPDRSSDPDAPRLTWWPRKGDEQWVRYDFTQPLTLDASWVMWFDDTGRGECAPPRAWHLEWLDGDEWKPVDVLPGQGYGLAIDARNHVRFEPVTTAALRLKALLRHDKSAGVLEWHVSRAP